MSLHLITLRPSGNKLAVVSEYDFLLMLCYIFTHNVVINSWLLCIIRDRVSSVFQLYYAKISSNMPSWAVWSGLKYIYRTIEGFPFLLKSQRVHMSFFFFFPTTILQIRSGFNFLPCILVQRVGNYELTCISVPRSIYLHYDLYLQMENRSCTIV